MFGHQLMLPVPDIDHTKYMLILGANPLESNGSIMSAPNMRERLKSIQRRNGKIVVLDPRRTKTAKLANEHIFIRPCTDAYFLFSLLNSILKKVENPVRLADFYVGLDVVKDLAKDFSPDKTASITGVPAGDVYRLADEFIDAGTAVCYGRVGVSTQPFGAQCAWLINLINITTGNFDRTGGAMFTNPAIDFYDPRLGVDRGSFAKWKSRVRGASGVQRRLAGRYLGGRNVE